MKYGPKFRLRLNKWNLIKLVCFKKYFSCYKSNRSSCQGWEQGQAQGLAVIGYRNFGSYENILKLDFGDGFSL